MEINMKTLLTTVSLGALIAGVLVQSANAQRPSNGLDARTRAIQQCMELNKKYNTDPHLPNGGVEHMYRSCMTNKGQMP
jgi:hypothetical protein